jgi:hypothetical protein
VIVHKGGKGYFEGVEYYRMGMTNALVSFSYYVCRIFIDDSSTHQSYTLQGRYPVHFHLLGDSCRDCYVKDSSFYRSFYRCISIHGTNGVTVSENVAYDVTGYCYYVS